MVGDPSCVSGVTIGWQCGTVLPFYGTPLLIGPIFPDGDLDYTISNLHTVEIKFTWPGSHTTTQGNSGSPVLTWRTAQGLLAAETSLMTVGAPANPDTEVIAVFSTIGGIENELGVDLCTNAANC